MARSRSKKAVADSSSDGVKQPSASRRKTASRTSKIVKKEDLVGRMHSHKKEVQEMRFGLSGDGRQKDGSRRNLRKQIARTATQLTTLRKRGGVRV